MHTKIDERVRGEIEVIEEGNGRICQTHKEPKGSWALILAKIEDRYFAVILVELAMTCNTASESQKMTEREAIMYFERIVRQAGDEPFHVFNEVMEELRNK